MAEWSIAPVLKTGDPQGSVGSNPTPSAIRGESQEVRSCRRQGEWPETNTGVEFDR